MIKVLNVRCHIGAQLGAVVYTSIDSKKNEFEMHKVGDSILVQGRKLAVPHAIPLGTVASYTIDPDSLPEFMQGDLIITGTEVTKNKGGRPPKQT